MPSTSPKIRVRAVIGTATVSSIGSCGRSADSRSSVAVVSARRYARANARGDVSARARGVSIAYISAYSPRSQASAKRAASRRSVGSWRAPAITPPANAPTASTSRGRRRRSRRDRGGDDLGRVTAMERSLKGTRARTGTLGRHGRFRDRRRAVTGIDWVILGAVVLLALFGWAQGFLAGVLALAGFAAGAWLGTRLAPLVLEGGSESQWAPAFALIGALVAGGVLAASFEGVGARLRARFSSPAFAAVDGALGAALTACVGLLIAWVLGAVALQAGPDIRRDVQRSAILQQLNAVLPPTGPLLNTLRALDPFPRIDGPEARVPAPRAAIARDPQVAAARESVVKILGTACGVGVEGSGWVAAPGVVVTNAHVVAGQDDTRVLARGDEPGLDAQAIAFDPRNDLAVLRVDGPRRAGARAGARSRARAPRRRSSASRSTGPTTCAPAGSARRARWSARTPTAAGRCGARSSPCAAPSAPATPAARWSTAPAAW